MATGLPNQVYVRNVAWTTTEDSLRAHFAPAGTVVSASVAASTSGRSKGHALVAFATAEEAANAIATLNNSVLDERTLEIRADRGATAKTPRAEGETNRRERKPRAEGAPKGEPRAPRPPAPPADPLTVFVRNLSWDTKEDALKAHFAAAGSVTGASIAVLPSGRSKGTATVTFASEAEANAAVASLQGSTLDGRNLEVKNKASKRARRPRGREAGAAGAAAGGDAGGEAGAGGARNRRRGARRRPGGAKKEGEAA